ncbi:DNA repair protein RecO [Thiocystis violascens]|uniref:DNA repair protein RecO n=1 Tax=Thiocystis violascens (strain ATCC 17096 / DSM 198 / 6111) TaxID=765911 RepID=I3Y6P9_THIV6|nr:DNA repair protein RecO [Thiocystis violascens]AFL72667.1 DNA replication and repair protein RecO [Thiocystis violascens DSM 198]
MSGLVPAPARDGLFQAFVLHRRDYTNTSLLLEVFGIGVGRFAVIAKGARRPRNPASALLQPFQPLWLAAVGRGEVRTLTRSEGAGRPMTLQGRALLGGFYLNELLIRLLVRHDAHDPLFAFYQDALARLAEGGELETLLRRFELRLLDELGYGPTLDREAGGREPVLAERSYRYEAERGLRRAAAVETGPVLSGATLLALTRGEDLDLAQRREARILLRGILTPYLGERPLNSRELYQRWYGARNPTESLAQ